MITYCNVISNIMIVFSMNSREKEIVMEAFHDEGRNKIKKRKSSKKDRLGLNHAC